MSEVLEEFSVLSIGSEEERVVLASTLVTLFTHTTFKKKILIG